MKFLLSAALFLSFTSSAQAWEAVETKMACDVTETAFAEFKKAGFEPVIVGKSKESMIVVWMNPQNSLLTTQSRVVQGTGITCIVGGAESGSTMIERSNPEDRVPKIPS